MGRKHHEYGRCHVTGKLRYRSKAKALKAQRTYYAQRRLRMTAYLCPHCQHWHAATAGKRERKAIEQQTPEDIAQAIEEKSNERNS